MNDRKKVQVERKFPSFDTERPTTSVLRGISANPDYSKILYVNSRTKIVYCLQVRQRRFLQDELEQISEPPDPHLYSPYFSFFYASNPPSPISISLWNDLDGVSLKLFDHPPN